MSDKQPDKDQNKDKYKDTVFLPKTDFPMRGGLPQKEPEILKKWQNMDLYGQMREAAKDKEKWVLHDGPPYANGNIHMGHALNKILKDVVVKSYSMLGYNTPYVPGWDCHGLPIEWKVEEGYREKGKDKDELDPLKFRAECRAFAQKWVDVQSEQFQRFGVTGDWKDPYLTMNLRSEGQIVREIHKFALNGGLYKGAKPVMWSTVEKTALAEAEVEYKEHKSITIWVKFPITKFPQHPELEGANIVIWTTTPWTIPANRAIAYSSDVKYQAYEIEGVAEGGLVTPGEKILVAEKLIGDVQEKAKIQKLKPLLEEPVCGADLFGQPQKKGDFAVRSDFKSDGIPVCTHPLKDMGYDFGVPVLIADHVTDDAGTGFVHTAPGHGEDDFLLIRTYNFAVSAGKINSETGEKSEPQPEKLIPIESAVDEGGCYTKKHPHFEGKKVFTDKGEMGEANPAVLRALLDTGKLLAKGSLKHEYPHSWRSKAPLIFRTTPQWFISMEKNDLRQNALTAISDTKWVPAKGEARINAMIENRPDWCISRQRAWGVPIALFVHKETDEILCDEAVLKRIGDTFEKEGSDSWWSRPAQDFLGNDYNAEDYDQIFDIVDVWFESGSTHAFVCEEREELRSPADLYLEGSDQHRGWFHSSLLESVGTRGRAPYKTVLTHGFVLDEKGYKMSKSAGNVVDPLKVMEQYGADILRLWTLTSDYAEDIRIGQDSIKQTGDLYRRVRNTLRFLLGALDGFTKDEMIEFFDEPEKLPELEQLVLHRLYETDQKIRGHIESYDFMKLTKALHDFCNEDLSAFYFDIRKDRLYCDAPDSFERRATRSVMAVIFNGLTAWLAPVLSFTAEEAWSHRPPGVFGDEESVHLRTFPEVPANWKNDALAEKWKKVKKLRDEVLLELEQMRVNKEINSSLGAVLKMKFDGQSYKAEDYENLDLGEICIVSDYDQENITSPQNNEVKVLSGPIVKAAEGEKCLRCWKILPVVFENGGLCNRCAEVVKTRNAA